MPSQGLSFRLSAVAVFAVTLPALGDDHPSGHEASPVAVNRFYQHPDGALHITQTFTRPEALPETAHAGAEMRAILPKPQGFRAGEAPMLKAVASSAASLQIGSVAGARANQPRWESVTSFRLVYRGIPLSAESSQSVVSQGTSGRLRPVLVSTRNLPSAEELNALKIAGDGKPPRVLTDRLEEVGLKQASQDYEKARQTAHVYIERRPEPPHLEIRKLKNQPARLVWTYIVASDNVRLPMRRRFFVPYPEGEGLPSFYDLVSTFAGQAQGTVKGTFWSFHRSAFSPAPNTCNGPLSHLTVVRGGSSATTGPDGGFTLAGHSDQPIIVSLSGPNCVVTNSAGSGAAIESIRDGNHFRFEATTELELAQVSAFVYVNQVAEFTKSLLNSPDLPANSHASLLKGLGTFVNIDETCNANWDGREINFYASGRCRDESGQLTSQTGVNTAYSDIIFHEYGHGVDSALGGAHDGGYGEGFGDSLAVLITRDHVVGPGWAKNDDGTVTHLRDTKNQVQWQVAGQDPEVHNRGEAYGGFVWSLIEALGGSDPFDVAKELVFGAALRDPIDIPDAVVKSFLFDYDSNGGDHYNALKQAARAHGLPYPRDVESLSSPETIMSHLRNHGDRDY